MAAIAVVVSLENRAVSSSGDGETARTALPDGDGVIARGAMFGPPGVPAVVRAGLGRPVIRQPCRQRLPRRPRRGACSPALPVPEPPRRRVAAARQRPDASAESRASRRGLHRAAATRATGAVLVRSIDRRRPLPRSPCHRLRASPAALAAYARRRWDAIAGAVADAVARRAARMRLAVGDEMNLARPRSGRAIWRGEQALLHGSCFCLGSTAGCSAGRTLRSCRGSSQE